DVVRLTREQQERLVLRFPAEPRDRPVVTVLVRAAGDTERRLDERVRVAVGDNDPVRNLLDQPAAKRRRRDPEAHVAGRELGPEVVLLNAAATGVGRPVVPAADDEQRVDAAVTGAVRA